MNRAQASTPRRRWTALWVALAAGLALAAPAHAQIDPASFNQDLRELCSYGSRVIGSPGYDQTVAYLRQQIGQIPNAALREQFYQVMVPVTQRADLTLADGTVEKVYPFWPAQVRLNTTPAGGIRGRLVYCGNAGFQEIHPQELAGQIAVIEASAGPAWTQVCYFGARAVLVLGRVDTGNNFLRYHDINMPVDLPRFYLPDTSPLADALRHGKIAGPATLVAQAHWESKTARNLYALIQPPLQAALDNLPLSANWAMSSAINPVPAGWTARDAPGAMAISVPLESSGLVPDLAVGASQAVQTASGLGLLREFARRPLQRPVLVCFVGADSIQMQGSRQMFMALSDVPAMWHDEMASLTKQESVIAEDLTTGKRVQIDPRLLDPQADRRFIQRLSTLIETDSALEMDELFRLRIAAAPTAEQQLRRQQLERNQIRYNALKYTLEKEPANLSATAEQTDEPSPLEMARGIVGRAIVQLSGNSGSAKNPGHTAGLLHQCQARQQQLQQRINLYRWLASALHRDPDPDARSNDSRLIELLVALDLSDGSTRCGPLYWGQFQRFSNISNLQDYKDWFSRQERGFNEEDPDCQWLGAILPNLSFEPLEAAEAPQSFLCASMAVSSEECATFGVPGFTLATLDDLRLRRDTPTDTLANLSLPMIQPQLDAVAELLRHAWNDPAFKGPIELKWQQAKITGQVVSYAPGRPVPDLPRPGFVATYYYAGGSSVPVLAWLPYTMGVRRGEVVSCDAEGNYAFEGLSQLAGGPQGGIELFRLAVEVYRIDDDGQISACSDLGQQIGDIKLQVNLKQSPPPLRSLVFDCRGFTLVGLYDPRYLQALNEVQLVDARRNAAPQRFNYLTGNQMMACFVEPDFQAFLAFRYGRIGNRLILVNMDNPKNVADISSAQDAVQKAARGFSVDQLHDIGPLSLISSGDFANIDAIRLDRYRKAGVRSELVDALQQDSDRDLAAAKSAYHENHGDPFVRSADGAWASQARVYQATFDMANDVIRGAIFLLLLCIPFSFCMERLLVGSPNIYRQLAGMAAIFTLMTAALWSFHPAFKISSSPLIVILAFAIMAMSGVVIAVIYSKFDVELKRLRSGRGTAPTTSFARASVLMSAVLLGIANMRKRKFRTALTSLTIILITFALLCFTSATRYLDATSLPTGVESSHYGIMLRQRGWRPLPFEALANLQADLPGKKIVQRWWAVDASDTRDVVHIVAGSMPGPAEGRLASRRVKPLKGPPPRPAGDTSAAPLARGPHPDSGPARIFSARGILGLSPGEGRLSPIAQILGPDFDRLEHGESQIIYLARQIAERLQVKRGEWVSVGGINLQVAGLYNSAEFDQRVLSLSGEPLAPLNYTSGELDTSGRRLDDPNSMQALELDLSSGESEMTGEYEHLQADQIAIVPAAVARLLPAGNLRSLAFSLDLTPDDLRLLSESELRNIALAQDIDGAKDMSKNQLADALANANTDHVLKDPAAAQDALVQGVSTELARRFSMVIYAGRSDGVKMIAATDLATVSGAGQVAIPLLIAALIIFNTMMGSIAERKREIHVYTSLGLAPLHVGALFIAEAMTYGLIGTVFGYIIGQGVGTAFNHLGWLGSLTLNYSGTSAMLTMGLVLAVVLLSALAPARLASKIAAPSIDRTWRVPLPKDGQIVAHLPFTINKTAADGVLAYLAEFFDAHREGSIGKFSSANLDIFTTEEPAGQISRGLKTIVWLTPFDLGVRQHLTLLIHPGVYQDIYDVQVILQRLSGDDRNWYRMNRTFLTELRKEFLQWRSLTPQHMLQYVEQSRRLSASAGNVASLAPSR